MRYDPTIDFLLSAQEARTEEERLYEQVRRLDARVKKTTTTLTGMPRGGAADPEKAKAALLDLKEKYTGAILYATAQQRLVEDFIDRLPTRKCRIVLRYRYLEGLSWDGVRKKMEKQGLYYEERQIYRIHGMALNEARDLWDLTHKEENA